MVGGVQLVSPVLYTDGNWQDGLRALYSALRDIFDIKVTRTCSTKIHFSPHTLEEMGSPAADMLGLLSRIFDKCIADKLPLHRAASDPYDCKPKNGCSGVQGITTDSPADPGTVHVRVPLASADVRALTHWTAWMLSFMAAIGHPAVKAELSHGKQVSTIGRGRERGSHGQLSPVELTRLLLRGYASLPPSVRDGLDITKLLRQDSVPRQLMTKHEVHIASMKAPKKGRGTRIAATR